MNKIEPLESRAFLSANAAANATIVADRLQVRADLLAFRSDLAHFSATVMTDNKALRSDKLSKDTVLEPLFKALRADVRAMQAQLKTDRLNQAANVLKDESDILLIRRQMILDRKNPDALATDKSNLLSTRIQLQTDEIAGLDARISTRRNAYGKITADLAAITSAVAVDTTSSAQLKTDVTTWVADRTNSLSAFPTDLTKIQSDRAKLAADLTALQSQT